MPYLIHNPGSHNEKVCELKFGLNTIGREQDNNIVINEQSLSRRHAEITVTRDGAIITDLHSRNGTFVNDSKIQASELKDEDLICCGGVVFKFVHALSSPIPAPEIEPHPDFSIVKRVSPEDTRVVMQDLLQQDSLEDSGSILKLRQQDANQRTVDKLKILLEVSKQLSSPEEYDKLLEKILDLLFTIMNVDRAVILMVNEETGELEYKAVKSRVETLEAEQFCSMKIANFVLYHGDAILTADACIDERFNDSESIVVQAIHASMCVPLKPKNEVFGVLYVDNLSTSNVYTKEDLEFLTGLANTAAIAIENANLYQKMQAEALMRVKLERFFPPDVSRKIKEEGELEIVDTEVTALFCDISNFTKMSSTMEPRQIIEMLNEYFQVMVEDIVFRYEGTLEKYIGDALLAVWGAPYQKPEDVYRAVKAAIEMQWAVSRLNQRWLQQRNLQIQVHIGLNTGKVAAGNIGSKKLIQYATIGDTTNVTSRICSAAKAGEILISEKTFNKLNNQIPIEKLSFLVWVKGKEEPLQLYRVLWDQVKLATEAFQA